MPSAHILERNDTCAVCASASKRVRALFEQAVKPPPWDRVEVTQEWVNQAQIAEAVWLQHPKDGSPHV